MLQQVTDKNFDDYIKTGIKLIAFTADWCGFCQKQKPVLQEISQQNIDIGEINSDENPNTVKKFAISGFPSFLLFKDGKMLANFSGYRPKYELMNTILEYLKWFII